MVIVSSLIVIFFADLGYMIIPDAIVISAIGLTLLRLLIKWYTIGRIPFNPLLSGLVVSVSLLALVLISRGCRG